MASPQAEQAKAKMRAYRDSARAAGASVPQTGPEFRVADKYMDLLTGEPAGVTYERAEVGEIPGQWVVPAKAAQEGVILYLHGGGYVIGSSDTHRKMVGHLATAAGVRAFIPDYRLAPEHPYPAAVKDGVAAFRGLIAQGVRAQKIVIAGDSAGGGLALATMLSLRDDGRPMPVAALLLSPWTDLAITGDSLTTRAEVDLTVAEPGVRKMAEMYLHGAKVRGPLASPLYADLRGMPPTYIQVGDEEVLLDDSLRVAEKMKGSRCDVTIEVYPEMQHVFQFGAGSYPEADDAIGKLGEFARRWLA